MPSPTLHTFDVFETCLIRPLLHPSDLFLVLAMDLLGEPRSSEPSTAAYDLARLRREAEALARRREPGDEVTLEAIYAALPDLAPWGVARRAMLEREVALEEASARPIAGVRERVRRLREAGERVVFVSDMYLPGSVVERMLRRGGLLEEGDGLYVSSEVGATKRSGRLFSRVAEAEGVAVTAIRHLGDHPLGDYLAPTRLGAHAELYRGSRATRYERELARACGGERLLGSRLAGAARVARLGLAGDEGSAATLATVAAGCAAPLLCAYVLWVLEEAERDGLERLYFVARDGQLLREAARTLGGERFELRYLYGSRQAWNLPAVTGLEQEGLEFVLMNGQSSAPAHALPRVGVTPDEVEEELLAAGFPRASWETEPTAEGVERLRTLLGGAALGPLVLERAAEARRAATGYFRQEGLLDGDSWALVDNGWTLRTQRSLRRLLALGGQERLRGFYLGLSESRFPTLTAGRADGFLVEEAHGSRAARALFRNRGVLDQVFTLADHGTTTGYRAAAGGWEPQLAGLEESGERRELRELMRRAVVAFAGELVEAGLARGFRPALRGAALASLGRFLTRPRRDEVRAFASVRVSDDPNELRTVPLARALTPQDLYRLARAVVVRLAERRTGTVGTRALFYKDFAWGFSWLEGSVVLAGAWARPALWALASLDWGRRERRALLGRLAPALGWALRRRRRRG